MSKKKYYLMIVKCESCGIEYELGSDEKPSDFQCECGGELSPNEMVFEPIKSPHEPIIEEDLDDKSKNKKIGIAGLFGIVLILVIIIAGISFFNDTTFSKNIKSGNTSVENSTLNLPHNTYSANGLTFNYPADWKQISNLNKPSRWGYGNPIVAYYQPIGNGTEYYIQTYFYIKQRDVKSLDEMLSDYRTDIAQIGQTEVSEKKITINGMKAVQLIKTWRNGNIQYKALTVHIEVIPGSKYYRIGCVVPASEYNATLPKFEMVVNSFKPN